VEAQPGPITLAGAQVDRYFHACALFRDDEEEQEVLVPYFREGLDNGERVLVILDPDEREARRQSLMDEGIDVEQLEDTRQLELLTWGQAYLRGGRFDQDAMLELLGSTVEETAKMGFSRTRIAGHMEWALTGMPGVEDLISYEARVNEVLARMRQPAVCAYRLERFDGRTLIDAMRMHPLLIIGNTYSENPLYMPAEQVLNDVMRRREAVAR
jgi:hypothetical protein